MAAEWVKLARSDGFSIEGEAIDVKLADGRHHSVTVRDAGPTYELHSIVARPSGLRDLADVPLQSWRRNRSAQLVGFRVDQRGRLVGEAWAPKVGLTAEEFQIYVRRVAAACAVARRRISSPAGSNS